MTYSIPYSFIPGTKARAQEVNANFKYVLDTADEINTAKLNTSLSNITPDAINIIKNCTSFRNIGEIIQSTGNLTDSGLHLLDGSLIEHASYGDFVDCIADLYEASNKFNRKSFTVVGSPTLSEEGVLSDVTTYDYVYTPSIDFSEADTWEIYTPIFNFTNLSTGIHTVLYSTLNQNAISIFVRANGKTSWGIWENLGDENPIFKKDANTGILENTNYQLRMVFTGSQYQLYLSTEGGEFILADTNISSVKTNINAPIYVGRGNGQLLTNGSLDLKKFSIRKNGVEIFSGNKLINYFTDEASWQSSLSNYGYCKKFVYDSVNNTVRLPKYIYEPENEENPGVLANYLYYIVIATSVQTDIQVDIDEIATDLNGKADKDLSNVTSGAFEHVLNTVQQSGKETIIGWGMPDYTAGVSISAANYVCPCNGIVVGAYGININGSQIFTFYSYGGYNTPNSMTAPVCKGDIINGSTSDLKFYPLKGEN